MSKETPNPVNPKKETWEDAAESLRKKLEDGRDRSKDSLGKNISDTRKDEESSIYEIPRKIDKIKQDKKKVRTTKNLATDAQRIVWNDERRGDRIGL